MRQNLVGMVVSTAMQKTVKVKVPRLKVHKLTQKEMLSHKNYLAHDESGSCILGDIVRIQACRPLSKKKHFSVAEVMKKARTYTDPETGKILQ